MTKRNSNNKYYLHILIALCINFTENLKAKLIQCD